MKVLVTGATGFFGPGIVARLRQEGHDVVAAARRPASPDAELDVSSPDSCRSILARHADIEVVVHAAALAHVPPGAQAAAACRAVNVEGTRHIADAARAARVRRFVFISSVTVYGDHDLPVPVTESTPLLGTSMYGAAKRAAELMLTEATASFDVYILRMATMYAPGWLFNIRKRVSPPLAGRLLYFTLDPERRRYSLCSRRNGSEAVLWAVTGRLAAGTYNVSDRYVYSQAEILRAVESVEGARPHVSVPLALSRMLTGAALLVPLAGWRANARSRYWKFCEHNVYSSERLAAAGLRLPPDLLALPATAPPC